MFAFYNFFPFAITVKKGDRIGQGVFKKFLKPVHGLRVKNDKRQGGFGSTSKWKTKKLSADTITRMLKTSEAGSMVIIDNEHSLDFSNIKELGYDTIEINIDNKGRAL